MAHIVNGSIETCLHDFEPTIEGKTITFSPGTYYQAGEVKFQAEESSIVQVTDLGELAVWLTDTGFVVTGAYDTPDNPIDRLMWFTATEEKLENVHFVRVVLEDASE